MTPADLIAAINLHRDRLDSHERNAVEVYAALLNAGLPLKPEHIDRLKKIHAHAARAA